MATVGITGGKDDNGYGNYDEPVYDPSPATRAPSAQPRSPLSAPTSSPLNTPANFFDASKAAQPSYAGMDPQSAFMKAVADQNLDPSMGRQIGLTGTANWLNAHGQTGWGGSVNAHDYISNNGVGYDVIPSNDANWQWTIDGGGNSGGGSMGGGSNGGNVFSDPATAKWEEALNALAGRLQQPQSIPDMGPLQDYLRKYFQQLQGPAYSQNDLDLIRTQTQDPLTAQRDAQRQQVVQHFAAQGVPPSSGIVQKALLDLDNNYNKLNTTNNATMATNAINVQRQQSDKAAQVGTALATLEQQNNAQDEARALQGIQMLFQVPQYADSRLGLAAGLLNQTNVNPSQLLSTIPGLNNSALAGAQFDQSTWAQLAPLLGSLFGSFAR